MNTTIKIISELEMLGFLKTNGTACRFVALTSETPVVKIKVGQPFGPLTKISRKIGIINANYNTSVRRRLAAETGVELSEVEYQNGEVWFKHQTTVEGKPLPVVVNKAKEDGKHYLLYFPHRSHSVYVNQTGEVVPTEAVKPWLYKESPKASFKPATISINLANVKELKASGVVMQAEDFEAAEAALAVG